MSGNRVRGVLIGWLLVGSVVAGPVSAEEPSVPVVNETQLLSRGLGSGGGDHFGMDVAIDGCVLAVDSYRDDTPALELFGADTGSWVSEGVVDPATRSLGFDVDGDMLVFGGAPTHVFRRGAGGWVSEAEFETLHPVGAVAVSGDTLAVGDVWGEAVHVYRRSLGAWFHEATVRADPPVFAGRFGSAVALDVDTMVVGAPDVGGADAYYGAAFVFTRGPSGWTQQAALAPIGGTSLEGRFGSAVGVDGDTVVVGEPGSQDSGAAHVFAFSGGGWSPEARLEHPAAVQYSDFGRAVAVDGESVLVGIPGDAAPHESGSAALFTRIDGQWVLAARLAPSVTQGVLGVGYSVGLSGARAAVGSVSSDSGHVFMYDLSAPQPCEPPVPPEPPVGYWMLSAAGGVFPFGDAGDVVGETELALQPGETTLTIRGNPTGVGAWVLTSHGRIIALGGAPHHGDARGTSPSMSVAGAARAAASSAEFTTFAVNAYGTGYWIFTDHGDVLPFGDVSFHGALTGVELNGPVIDSAATTSGLGYWLLGSDGGVFAFGDAAFHGSMGGATLNEPAVGLVPDPDGVGYWFVAADGGVFAFDAPFRGSVPGVLAAGATLVEPVNGMVAYGNGYLMVAGDGGVFTFSDLEFLGSLGAVEVGSPVVSIAPL